MLTTAQQVRLLVSDPVRATSQWVYGDGTATAFYLSGAPLYSGTAPSVNLLSGAGALSATGGTAFDFGNGILAFATALSASSAALVNYSWSVISEAELEFVTAHYASLEEMVMGAIQAIQASYAKLVKWAVAQGPNVDPSQAQQALALLWAQYNDKTITRHAEGGLESYAEFVQPAGGVYPGFVNRNDGFWS